jgi:Flp pilus assembly pilin Flp
MTGARTVDRKEFVMTLLKSLRRFAREEQGTETLEWGLVCGLIVVGAIVAITLIGPKVTTMWNNMNTAIP